MSDTDINTDTDTGSDTSTDIKPPAEWFFDCLVLQGYGHSQFGEVDTPEYPEEEEYSMDDPELADLLRQAGLKEHPIAKSVYFSGTADPKAYQLPHMSKEALKNYLDYQLKLQKNLQLEFNPKPNM